jgi:anti-anti-sigma factor
MPSRDISQLYDVEVQGHACLVRVRAKTLLDAEVIQPLSERIAQLLDKKMQRRVALDLSAVESVSSSMLGEFVRLKAHFNAVPGGNFVLLKPSPRLRQLLKMTGLDRSLDLFDDEAKALKKLGA